MTTDALPLFPRKLVAWRVTVNVDPGTMAADSTLTRNDPAPLLAALARSRTKEVLVTGPPLFAMTEYEYVRSRPPEPEVLLPSSTRSSHRPTLADDADSATSGTVAVRGWPTAKVWPVANRLAEARDDWTVRSLIVTESPGSTVADSPKVIFSTVPLVKLQ